MITIKLNFIIAIFDKSNKMAENVLQFWFPNNDYQEFWFNGEKDHEIVHLFKDLFHILSEQGELYNEWLLTPTSRLACLIVLDQFSRNLSRHDTSIDYKKYDHITLSISEEMMADGIDKNLPLSQRIFILLPLRHYAKSQNNSTYLYKVLSKLKEYEDELGNSPLLTRFRNATFLSFTNLTDRIYNYKIISEIYDLHKYDDVLDESYKTFTNPLETYNEKIMTMLIDFVKKHNLSDIGVSLSGGLDSMTLVYLFKILEKMGFIRRVYAMHLEYINRKESSLESEMIATYCSLLDVPLYIRVIDYMSRDSVDRNFYEKTTKDVRFATYRYLSEKLGINGWCLGHISDDVSENVAMNIFGGRDLLDVIVMDEKSIIESVTILRPFLYTKKEEIYKLALLYCIPHTKYLTPDWSLRGTLRKKIIPAIKTQWPNVMDTLVSIGEQSNQWKGVIDNLVMKPIIKEILIQNNIVIFTIKEEYKSLPLVIWTNIFLHIFHKIFGIKMISHKNLLYFVEMLPINTKKNNKFNFSNKCTGIFQSAFQVSTLTIKTL